jgi:transglutaminase-like putative cysteine protease
MSAGTGMGMGSAAAPGMDPGPGMDGGLRVAFAAWLATLAAAGALMPLVKGTDWLVQAGLLLACQTGTGVLIRWRGAPGVVAFAAQAVVSLLMLTVVTVPDYATAGLLPGPAALDRFGDLLTTGADDVSHYVAPAPVTDGIRLMLLGGVLLIGLLVDLLAVSLRSAAASGLPLLALYSVAAGVSQDEASWPYFLCAAAGYLLLLLSEGRDRLTRWGRFFAGPGIALHPAAAYPGAAPAPPPPAPQGPRVRTGRRIGAVTLGVAALAPLLLPSLGDGLLGLAESGGGSGEPGDITAVNPVVALQDQLNQPEDRTVLSYRTSSPESAEMYLRLVALDEFDGEEWRSSREWEDPVPDTPWEVPGLSAEVNTTRVVTTIAASEDYAQTSLPVPYPALRIETSGDWQYDRGSQTLASDDGLTTQGRSYEVEHLLVEPTAEQLAGAPDDEDEELERYTEVPDDLPPEVAGTALGVTAQAGNDYERAVALQDWFTREGGFRYDTSVASGSGSDAIIRFLEQREGFCVHFAFTMAAMARTLDIPAQVAVGFTPGDRQADGSYEVGIHNAHAWPELYFDGVGWVRFEPTPGQGSAPAYTLPEPTGPEQNDPTDPEPSESPEPTPSDSATPTPTPTESEECDPALDPGACRDQEQSQDGDDEGIALPVRPMLYGGGGLLIAGLLASPLLWRRRLRSRRLAPDAGPLAAWRELNDAAWDYCGTPPLAAETPRQAAQRIARAARLADEPAAAVHRLADAVEWELYAPQAPQVPPTPRRGDGSRLAADVRGASTGLRLAAGRATRLRALLLPRSAMRVMHALTERRIRGTQRLSRVLNRLTVRRRGQRA